MNSLLGKREHSQLVPLSTSKIFMAKPLTETISKKLFITSVSTKTSQSLALDSSKLSSTVNKRKISDKSDTNPPVPIHTPVPVPVPGSEDFTWKKCSNDIRSIIELYYDLNRRGQI
jgi:hypothetical protein